MYIRSNSEPPDQNEDQLKNGLRGGFPIKINGYALGSQENLQDLGRESSTERTCIFGPRVRSRQNSVSRQSSVSRTLESEGQEGGPLYSATPFGPLQGKTSGSKLSHKPSGNNNHINRVSSSLSNQIYSSTTSSESRNTETSLSSIVSESRNTETSLSSTFSESRNTETSLSSVVSESKNTETSLSSTISESRNTETSSLLNLIGSPAYDPLPPDPEVCSQSEQKQDHQVIQELSDSTTVWSRNEITESGSSNEVYESVSQSQPSTVSTASTASTASAAPFMFQRPKAFQANIHSRNASKERSQRGQIVGYQEEDRSYNVYNKSRISSETSQSDNIVREFSSAVHSSNSHNQSYNNSVSEQNHTILQECSETNKLSTGTLHRSDGRSEERTPAIDKPEGSETQHDSSAEHYNAQCRYETSQNSREKIETSSSDIKEFNIEAKIVIRPTKCEILNTRTESKLEAKTAHQQEEQQDYILNQTTNYSDVHETQKIEQDFIDEIKTYQIKETQKIEHGFIDELKTKQEEYGFIDELKLPSDCQEQSKEIEQIVDEIRSSSLAQLTEKKEEESKSESIEQDLFINPHQKDIIKCCIEELERLAEFDNEIVPTEIDNYISAQTRRNYQGVKNEEYEEVEFSTEEIIDSEDLEHFHVVNTRSEQRRLSSQIDSFQMKEIEQEISINQTDLTPADQDHNEVQDELGETDVADNPPMDEMADDEERLVETGVETMGETLETEGRQERQDGHERHEKAEMTLAETLEETEESHERRKSFFLTETEEESRVQSKYQSKRERNRTIDYHSLPSLYWEASVQNYHEKQYVETEETDEKTEELELEDKGGIDLAKDGLSLILQKLQEIESKLDNLPKQKKVIETKESQSVGVTQTPEPRRLSLPGRFTSRSLTDLTGDGEVPIFLEKFSNKISNNEARVEIESLGPTSGSSSNCSTPTLMEIKNIRKEAGYESDSTVLQDSDCEGIIDEKSENDDRESYRAFNMNIMEISDLSSSEDEDLEGRSRRIEEMAAAMSLMNNESSAKRAELNMDIDTLSERSEEETEKEERQPKQRSRRTSGRKRSMSRERSVAKIRYCWRCHKAGHENWQCREEVQPGGWCPRCLETTHWEDQCWVEATAVICPICNLPGHLPCIHQATDFRQRKLVIDTFGWLPFKEWFQDLTFRSWWNCSGYTGVPLYKILQRNPEQDLDLGFEETDRK